jgi:hypothetical protein
MRAELSVSHDPGNMRTLLESLYGSHSVAALHKSALASKAPASAESIDYAASHMGLIIMASFVGNDFVLYIESSGGQLRAGAVSVWNVIRHNAEALKPRLGRLVLLDEDANDVVATVAIGVRERLLSEELFVPIATGAVTAIVLGVVEIFSKVSSDFVYGSATALVVAILSVIRLLWMSRSKELVWR